MYQSVWYLTCLRGMKYTIEPCFSPPLFKSFTHDLERVLQCVKSITPNKGSKVREVNCHAYQMFSFLLKICTYPQYLLSSFFYHEKF